MRDKLAAMRPRALGSSREHATACDFAFFIGGGGAFRHEADQHSIVIGSEPKHIDNRSASEFGLRQVDDEREYKIRHNSLFLIFFIFICFMGFFIKKKLTNSLSILSSSISSTNNTNYLFKNIYHFITKKYIFFEGI